MFLLCDCETKGTSSPNSCLNFTKFYEAIRRTKVIMRPWLCLHISLSSRRPYVRAFGRLAPLIYFIALFFFFLVNIYFFCFVICRFCPYLPKVEALADCNGSNNPFCYTFWVTRGPFLALSVSILVLIVEFFASSFRLFILFINSVAKSNMRDVHVLFLGHKDV